MKKVLSSLFLIFCCFATLQLTAQNSVERDMGKPKNIGKSEFLKEIYNFEKSPGKWVYEGKQPCIIDFYADWCAPCRRLSPILESVAKDYAGKLKVYKVDVEAQRELASQFGIQSLPTILFVPMGGEPESVKGLLSQSDMERIISQLFKLEKTAK